MNVHEWIDYGIEQGYADKFCYIHESPELTDEESELFYNGEGEEDCIPTLRVWMNPEQNPLSSRYPNIQQPNLFE